MNQVSRPMQILLAAVLVVAVAWFTVLKPGEEVVEEPIPVASTPAATTPESGVSRVIKTAKDGAANANAEVAQRDGLTGETDPNATTPADETADGTASATSGETGEPAAANAPADPKAEKASTSEKRAAKMLVSIQRDQKAGRVPVVIVYDNKGIEEKYIRRVIRASKATQGKSRLYRIPVSQIGAYDAIVGTLSLGQTPSTIVIAPDSTAKVLGGLISTERLNRLISSASQVEPADDKQPAPAAAP